ncbi:response regulator transcription factor [Qingrenia yutianensis]|uniref:Stage 0 sporulation protein A homolog n=1 Tax=Qingrenia yutianensis TaxID=2763676 RepID=A0A926FBQ5_9FIRM|nr:response regulator transcription factor [Qingrenia yutianensis]MBC8595434.1 response regulator transcription factor [Qingrenia yutianensis]
MEKESRILVVDDDKNICELIRLYLQKEGYTVEIANDGLAALEKFSQNPPAAVILDIMLPKIDGIEVLKRMRKAGNIPVIMLTAKGEVFDKVLGLELGADDYMVKPFEPKELVARLKAVLRRFESAENLDKEIVYPNIRINLSTYELVLGGKSIDIPPKELELLYFLASHPNRVFTRDQLLDEVWGYDFFGDSRTVDVHVKRLREKLEGYESSWQLKTVWRVGYKFEVAKA